MSQERVYNFSAGPSMLPLEVLEIAGAEITNYHGSGQSVMEMSHRSKVFADIFAETKEKLKKALSIPDNYKILFLQGGASMQFSMVPMNLMGITGKADYAVTGNFSGIAMKEAARYGKVSISANTEDRNHSYIPPQGDLKLDPEASYFFYCENNTIFGTEWKYVPETGGVPIVCDMSSNILSKPIDVSKYGLIFVGAQKNMAPAGVTVVIVREDLAGNEFSYTPTMLSYATMIKSDSMHNTPPTWCIYMLGLVLDWLEKLGGVTEMQKIKAEKASILYDFIDESGLFIPHAEAEFRSDMNVTFRTKSPELDAKFIAECEGAGLVNIAGHRSVGGMRASIYNAMPVEGIRKLVELMKNFEIKNK